MKSKTCLLSLSLLLAGSCASRACWTFAWDPQGVPVQQTSRATITTPLKPASFAGYERYFDQLGFYDPTGMGLPRDMMVGIWNVYDSIQVTIPAGPATRESGSFRWAYLDRWFFLDPDGENYLYYQGEVGDMVRLVSRTEVGINPLFELAGNGYQFTGIEGPPFPVPPDAGLYVFGANAQYIPEPGPLALVLVTLLGAAGFAWRRRHTSRD